MKMLFLGEANFAFTSSLIKCGLLTAGEGMICTAFESREEALRSWPESLEQNLNVLKGCDVRFSVDATALHKEERKERFDSVTFMFPALRVKGRIDLSRALLRDVAKSVAHVLTDDGQFHVALAPGQGGTSAELAQYVREPQNTWQVLECMSEGALFLHHSVQLSEHPWGRTGYTPTGRRGNNSTFHSHGSVLHTFVLRNNATNPPTVPLSYFPRDVSMFLPQGSVESDIVAFVATLPHVGNVDVLDRFVHPKSARQSLTLRLALRGFISPTEAIEVQRSVGDSVSKKFAGVQIR